MGNTRQTKLIRVLAFIVTLLSAYATYRSIESNNIKQGIVSFLILTVSGFSFWHLGKSKEERDEPDAFLAQLQKNKKSIVSGGWEYRNNLIIPETILTQYNFTISLITVSFTIQSRFYIVDQEDTKFVNFIFTTSTIILGWWGLPWGPIKTVQSLLTNLKGGNQISVESVIRNV